MRSTLLVLLLLLSLTACGGSPENDLWGSSAINKAKQRGVLRVAMEPEFPPFEFMEGATVKGFDVDLARMLAAEIDIDVEFVMVEWDSIIPALESGKADLIISGMTATPLRAMRVNYSDPYFHTATCLLVSVERGADIKSIADLDKPGRKVMVKLGTTGETAARKRCPNAEIKPLKKEVDAANEVATGRADAFLFDRRNIQDLHARFPRTTRMLLAPVSVEPYAIACPKGDPETVAWLNLALHHMRRDGRLEALYAKYELEDIESK
jgi:polar amino acid transport system substrate-binding protein